MGHLNLVSGKETRFFCSQKLMNGINGFNSKVAFAPTSRATLQTQVINLGLKTEAMSKGNCDSDSSQTSSGEPVRVVRQFIFKDIFI